jgi:hypothetical protein
MKKYFNFFPKGGTKYDTDYGAIYVTPPLIKVEPNMILIMEPYMLLHL